VTSSLRFSTALIAVAFLLLHLPFLPRSLEDLDSINFALGLRDFDVAAHQPHPPGYPLFIFVAKGVWLLVGSEAVALSLVGIVAGALAVFPLAAVFRTLMRDRRETLAVAAALMALTSPLFWVTASRPLSDMAGLAAALVVQALALTALTPDRLVVAALVAGLGAGVRSQVVWLTVPILVLMAFSSPWARNLRVALRMSAGYLAGVLVWAVPLVVVTGGPLAYARAVLAQGAEDFTGVAMLSTTPTIRLFISALRDTFLTPWGHWASGAAVLGLAALGFMRSAVKDWVSLATLSVIFGPYLLFHLLFQETVTTRYALPLVVPVAFLAVRGAELVGRRTRLLPVAALTVVNIAIAHATLAAYSSAGAPAFRLLADMRTAGASLSEPDNAPILAMHRREEFDLRRPIRWMAGEMPALAGRLGAPSKHEWLEVVKYWNEGGRNPVWFVADPLRSDLALFHHEAPRQRYRWPFAQVGLVGGVRPNIMDWYSLQDPAWYLGEGWSLTPETAGVAGEDGKGPGRTPIEGWVRRFPSASTVMVGGRNLVNGGPPIRLTVLVDEQPLDEWSVAPGFFLRLLKLEPGRLAGQGDYARLTVSSDRDGLAIEQFDAQPAGQPVFGFAEGWHEQEHNPATGLLWRWTSDRALLRVRPEGRDLSLILAGETDPSADDPRIVVRAGGRVVVDEPLERAFSIRVAIPASLVAGQDDTISIETNQTHIPAEESWRSPDRRRLGLKVYECRITPVS
jgi:hypothetical protein